MQSTCAILLNDTARCWSPDSTVATPPQDVFFSFVQVSAAIGCGIDMDGTAHCWGGGVSSMAPPMPIGTQWSLLYLDRAVSSYSFGGGLTTAGKVVQFGNNGPGVALDSGAVGIQNEVFVQIAVAQDVTCGIRASDHTVRCFTDVGGTPLHGQNFAPTIIPPEWVSVKVDTSAACGQRADGTVACWGAVSASAHWVSYKERL